jgi:hypothetical protein
MDIRRTDIEIFDKDVAQALVIVLPGMDRDMLAMLVEHSHDEAKPDDLRPGAENGHYLHSVLDI